MYTGNGMYHNKPQCERINTWYILSRSCSLCIALQFSHFLALYSLLCMSESVRWHIYSLAFLCIMYYCRKSYSINSEMMPCESNHQLYRFPYQQFKLKHFSLHRNHHRYVPAYVHLCNVHANQTLSRYVRWTPKRLCQWILQWKCIRLICARVFQHFCDKASEEKKP